MGTVKSIVITVACVGLGLLAAGTGVAQKKGGQALPRGNSDLVFETASNRGEHSVYTEGVVYRTYRDLRPGEAPMVGYAVCSFDPEQPDENGCLSEVIIMSARNESRDRPEKDGTTMFRRRFAMDTWFVQRVDPVYVTAWCLATAGETEGLGTSCVTPFLHFNRITMQVKFSESINPEEPAIFMIGKYEGRIHVL